MSDYGMSVRIDATIEEALEWTRAALAEQGFGILTEIDVAATLGCRGSVHLALCRGLRLG